MKKRIYEVYSRVGYKWVEVTYNEYKNTNRYDRRIKNE